MKVLLNSLFVLSLFIVSSAFTNPTNCVESIGIDITKSSIKWKAEKVTGTHFGTINITTGSLDWNDGMLVGGAFEIDMKTITVTDLTGEYKQKLEGHLNSDDFFSTANFPKAMFAISSIDKTSEKDIYNVTGDLTIKGITNPISFKSNITKDLATAKIIVDRSKYDVRYGSNSFFDNLGDKAIYDDFELNVELVLE